MLHSLQIVQILDLIFYLVKSLNEGPLCLDVVLMIVCYHLLRCLHLYFLRDWCHFTSIWICSKTSKATAFDLYDGVFVIWIKHFFGCNSFASFHSFTPHFPIPLHIEILYLRKNMAFLILPSDDVSIIFSILTRISLDFIYGNR
jgi:hypothetical protein